MQLNKSKGGMSLVGEIIVIKNMGKYLHDIRLSDIRCWPRVISVKKKVFFSENQSKKRQYRAVEKNSPIDRKESFHVNNH